MKGMDIFCSSPASTAICVSLDQKSMIRNSSRAIDRNTPRIIDGRRASTGSHPSPSRPVPRPKQPHTPKPRKSSSKQSDLNSPLGSSRYLLGDNAFLDVFNDFDPISAIVPVPVHVPAQSRSSSETKLSTHYQLTPYKHPPPQPRLTHDDNQVVVLRVSLHCKGCEGKVRKHISRMEGVKSFNIDFQAKKVTVIGDITPLGVLASISRVKNAQFWPSPPSSTSSTSSSSLSSYSHARHSTSF